MKTLKVELSEETTTLVEKLAREKDTSATEILRRALALFAYAHDAHAGERDGALSFTRIEASFIRIEEKKEKSTSRTPETSNESTTSTDENQTSDNDITSQLMRNMSF